MLQKYAFLLEKENNYRTLYKKQWVTSQPPIVHFNLNLNYEKFICLFTLQKCTLFFNCTNNFSKKIDFFNYSITKN